MREQRESLNKMVVELIKSVRCGNQESFSQMLDLYEPLFASLLAKFKSDFCNEQDIEDMRQEITVVFYNSILSYDIGQSEVDFGLYAKICMTNALITQIRKMKRHNGALAVSTTEEDFLSHVSEEDNNPASGLIRNEEINELNQRIERVLSEFENRVWRLYMSGYSTREIALMLSKGEKSVDNAIFRIRQKLKTVFIRSK